MAKKSKKNENLTLEEKLEQALIPNWDEPYKLPDNWCWTYIKDCCKDIFSGKSPKYSKEETIYHIIGQQANQRYGLDLNFIKYGTKEFAESQDDKYWLRKNDVILNTLGTGSIGRSGIIECSNRLLTDGHLFVFRTSESYIPKFLYYYLQLTEEQIINTANGSTNQKFLSLSSFLQFPVPLAPLNEQSRIVNHIENLFSKLDEVKEKAQEVIDGFENRRAAILYKAFSGELTAKWRKENEISFDTWANTTIGKESELITKGASPKWQGVSYVDDKSQTLFITSENVREGYLDMSKEKYLDNKINEIQKRSILKRGDVLVNIVGASIGRAAIFDFGCLANINQAVCLIRVLDNVRNNFLCYLLNSPYAINYYNENKVDVARANISLANINNMKICLPTLEEQDEIIHILDCLLFKEQQAKDAAEVVVEQIDAMKKAILARAFRGELGTNDPTEENAIELLKNILEAESNKKEEKVVPVRLTIPKEISEQLSTELEKKIVKTIMKNNGNANFDEILAISSKKFDVLETVRKLEGKNIIVRDESGEYTLKG